MKANPVSLGRLIAAALVTILAILAWMASGAPGRADTAPPCRGLADVLADLSETYGEVPIWEGRTDAGQTVILTVSPGGEGWTLFAVRPDDQACYIESGISWRPSPDAPVPGVEG